MTSTRSSLFALAALALSGSIALAQQPTPPASPSNPAPAAAPAPPARGMRPAMGARPDMRGGPGGASTMRGRDGFGGGMGGGLRGPGGMWWKSPRIVELLALTPDQSKKMDDIFQQSRLQLIDLKANVERQQVLLEPMLSANPLDMTKASAQIDKVAQSRADLEKANAKMLLAIRAVLTPDQWTKLSTRGRDGDPQGGPDGKGSRGGSGGRGRGGPPPPSNNLIDPIDIP